MLQRLVAPIHVDPFGPAVTENRAGTSGMDYVIERRHCASGISVSVDDVDVRVVALLVAAMTQMQRLFPDKSMDMGMPW